MVFSFCYFFFLMSGYFIMRPVRDEMGIQAGVENMQWLFTGTFIAMLAIVPVFGLLIRKVRRDRLIPGIYLFFVLNILGFYLAFQQAEMKVVSVVFFIWLSVYNLFVISVFWSTNSDIFKTSQAKRLYGPIAAGGSTGAIVGPTLTTILVNLIGIADLLLISAAFLFVAALFSIGIFRNAASLGSTKISRPIGGSVWEGFTRMIRSPMLRQIGLFIILYTTISTFLYFEQAHIISEAYASSAQRTTYFGLRDLTVNIATLAVQFFLTHRLLNKYGVGICLMIVPVIAGIGFLFLGIFQSVAALFAFQVLYRSMNFSVQRPSRELLFTNVSVEERYKSKNFIDTALYRGGDAMSGWLFTGISTIVGSLQLVAFITIPIALLWAMTGKKIGRLFNHQKIVKHDRVYEEIIAKRSA